MLYDLVDFAIDFAFTGRQRYTGNRARILRCRIQSSVHRTSPAVVGLTLWPYANSCPISRSTNMQSPGADHLPGNRGHLRQRPHYLRSPIRAMLYDLVEFAIDFAFTGR
jgi:hypothetical protein